MLRFFCCIFIYLSFAFSISTAEKIGKKAAIVIDYTNNKNTVFQDNAYEKRHPASLTKVMTLYLLFEAIKNKKISFNTKFKVSKIAAIQMPSKVNLKVGEKITVINIIRALAIKSANDVAVVAAEGLCGSVKNFCNLMNQKAKQMGMKSTHFENPSGVPNKKQMTTAKDMAILGMAVFRDYPQHWHFFSEKSFNYKGTNYDLHCKILRWYKGADGGKTGYTCASGFNLIVSANKYSNSGNSKRVFVVVMGGSSGKSRDFYAAQLMDRYLKGYTICSSGFSMKKAKEKLLQQVSKAEMIEPIIHELDEISIDNVVKTSVQSKKYFDELYQYDEDIVQIEDEIFIKSTKKHIKLKKKSKNGRKRI